MRPAPRPRCARRAAFLALFLGALLGLASCDHADGESHRDDASRGAAGSHAAPGEPAAAAHVADVAGGADVAGVAEMAGVADMAGVAEAEAPPALAAVRSEPVVGRTGPGGVPFEVAVRDPGLPGHDRIIGRRPFRISLRGGGGVAEYPCESCHRPGAAVLRPVRAEDAHRNLLPRHPEAAGSPCVTCHAPDRVDHLVLIGGERVPLAHAYRLCGQCHYPQADAWAAGAHGKRLDGWRGRRVVMGCPDCHDPHQPAIEPRIPFPGPRPPRAGDGEP